MWNQTNIFGEKLPIPTEEDLKEICCESCYTAKEEECTCKCHGAYHGLGNLNHKSNLKGIRPLDPNDKILPENEAHKFRLQYGKDKFATQCGCGYDLKEEPIAYYTPHTDGWTVQGEPEKVWLFIHCPNCGNDQSIWKMGVPRE